MRIVIDIPDDMIKSIEQGSFGAKYNTYDLVGCLMSGTPLPKGHGRLIDADVLKTAFPCGESVRTECVRATIDYATAIIAADKDESEDKLDGDPIDIDKAVEHYERTIETLKGVGLEVGE